MFISQKSYYYCTHFIYVDHCVLHMLCHHAIFPIFVIAPSDSLRLQLVNIFSIHIVFLGLEAQLLAIVVRKERPELEEQKDNLVRSIAAGKKKLNECEDDILRYALIM